MVHRHPILQTKIIHWRLSANLCVMLTCTTSHPTGNTHARSYILTEKKVSRRRTISVDPLVHRTVQGSGGWLKRKTVSWGDHQFSEVNQGQPRHWTALTFGFQPSSNHGALLAPRLAGTGLDWNSNVRCLLHRQIDGGWTRDGSGSGSVRVSVGFGFSGFVFGVGFSPTVFRFGFGFGFGFRFWFPPVDIQWISEINYFELKLMFYNMLMIICLLRLLNLLKVESWKYLLFVASYLYIWICVYLSAGFGYPFGFWVSAGLVLVMDFHPNRFRVRVSISGFGFGCTETPPDPNPTRCHP